MCSNKLTNKNIIENLKNKIIISVQAAKNEPLYDEKCINALIESVVSLGGAKILRLAGQRDIINAKKMYPDIIVIGITKPDVIPSNYKELVYITPSLEDVDILAKAEADIIAFDSTLRVRGNIVSSNNPTDEIKLIIERIKSHNKLAMADVSTFEEGVIAANLGADIISTTLSGYTLESELNSPIDSPDFALLEKLTKNLDIPIILEGKIWNCEDVKKAFELKAYSVVIGSAVTRPQLIVKRFNDKCILGAS